MATLWPRRSRMRTCRSMPSRAPPSRSTCSATGCRGRSSTSRCSTRRGLGSEARDADCRPYHSGVAVTPARTPRIGATTYRETVRRDHWDELSDLLPSSYATAVERAGGVAMLVPPAPPTHAAAVLDGIDGLLLSGGADIDPQRYEANRHPHAGASRPDRDAWELALRSEEHTSELQSRRDLVCRLLLEKKK